MSDVLQLVDGKLVPLRELCITHAIDTYLDREQDTNRQIVRMKISGGEEVDHWYYRSDSWIDQPYLLVAWFIQPYVGPTNGSVPPMYGEGTFIPEKDTDALVAFRKLCKQPL